MKRKITVISAFLFALLSVLTSAADKPKLKVGILSDVHISDGKSSGTFVKALEYFRDNGVDAVMIAGDMIEMGLECQIKIVSDCWYSVFPMDKGLNGKHVEKLFIYGNHEINGHKFKTVRNHYTEDEIAAQSIAPRREEIWEKYFHEKYKAIYIKDVKGYKFIGAHFQNVNNTPGLEEFFTSVSGRLPKDKPFFYFQHTHPKGTCSTSQVWGQDDGSSTALLGRYPNVICFSGHSHTTLTDERTIWQGDFTSVGTASLKYLNLVGKDHENGKVAKGAGSEMYRLTCKDGQQGQLMTVYSDRVELLRHDFKYDEDLGVWSVPVDSGSRPYSHELRSENQAAPQFGPKAVVKLIRKDDGKDRLKDVHPQVWVRFPSIASEGAAPRAWDFQVDAEVADGDSIRVVASKKVFARGCYLGEGKDKESGSLCVFALSELPAGIPVRFAVYPMNCFGRKGSPIRSKDFRYE